ncbi:MAG: outer membrane protein [Longimicrobiales bacterium]
MITRALPALLIAGVVHASSADSAFAQEQPLPPVRATTGGALLIAVPIGEFDDYIDTGWGLTGHFAIALDRHGIISLRADASFVNYGNETREVCFGGGVGCLITLDLTTSNNILSFQLGTQITVPDGIVRPYIHGGIGGSYFATTSSVEGSDNNNQPFASTTNFDDFTFSWTAGAGLRIPLSHGRTPVSLDLGARLLDNGEVEYLREGRIIVDEDGSLILDPIRGEADLVKILIGVSVGLRW